MAVSWHSKAIQPCSFPRLTGFSSRRRRGRQPTLLRSPSTGRTVVPKPRQPLIDPLFRHGKSLCIGFLSEGERALGRRRELLLAVSLCLWYDDQGFGHPSSGL